MGVQFGAIRNWAVLASSAASTAAVIFLFWPEPPHSGSEYKYFGRWMIAAILAVFIPLFLRLYRSRDVMKWAIATAVTLVFCIGVFLIYDLQRGRIVAHPKTEICGPEAIVVGSEYQSYVPAFIEHHPEYANKESLLENSQCDATKVWTENSIERNKNILTWTYLLGFPLFAACMFSAGQTVSCMGENRSGERGPQRLKSR